MTPIQRAILIVGSCRLAKAIGVTPQSMYKWRESGNLPRTEWTGETCYAHKIEKLTNGRVTKTELLQRPWIPVTVQRQK